MSEILTYCFVVQCEGLETTIQRPSSVSESRAVLYALREWSSAARTEALRFLQLSETQVASLMQQGTRRGRLSATERQHIRIISSLLVPEKLLTPNLTGNAGGRPINVKSGLELTKALRNAKRKAHSEARSEVSTVLRMTQFLHAYVLVIAASIVYDSQ